MGLYGVLAALMTAAASLADGSDQRLAEPTALVFARAESEVELKTEVFRRIFGKEKYDWSVDLDAGTISFTSASKVVTAPVQVIGTYNTRDGSFLWGWDHPSVAEPRGADARLARAFGQRNGLAAYTTRKVDCTEAQAWRFTAVAAYLAGAQGTYRGPSGTTLVFMTFGTLTIAPAG